MAWAVVFRPLARGDIRSAADWFAQQGRRAEAQWRARLVRAVRDLEADPRRDPQAEEAAALGWDLRERLIGRRRGIVHRMLYTVEGETVTVHRVRHAAMDALSEVDF